MVKKIKRLGVSRHTHFQDHTRLVDPEARPICQGKLSQPVQFGRKVVLQETENGIITGYKTINETIKIFKKTKTDFIFRGFWKWMPVVESPDDIPPELLELAPEGATLEQAADHLRRSGHYSQELERWISAIKKEMPDIIFCSAIPAQTLARIEYNSITNKVYSEEETRAMALDPQKWNITKNGKPVTKEQLQKWLYGIHPYGGKLEEEYDWKKVPAYLPNITNPDFQELLLSWAKKQIDSGADAASKIVDEIHEYGYSKGKYIYVGCWAGLFVNVKVRNIEFPYSPPNIDFVTVTPKNKEILDKKLNKTKWDKLLPAIKEVYGNVPVFAFIDWSFDESPTVMFSQKLSKEEQREVLKT